MATQQANAFDDDEGDDELSAQMLALLMDVGPRESGSGAEDGGEDGNEDFNESELNAAFAQSLASTKGTFVEHGIDGSDFWLEGASEDRERATHDEDDFEPEDWAIFYALRDHMRLLTSATTRPGARMKHLRWMMMPIADSQGLTFTDACHALQSRLMVVRTRAFYQLWRKRIALDLPKDGLTMCAPLPPMLAQEIGMHPAIGHIKGVKIMAKTAWEFPSVSLDTLLAKSIDRGVEQAAKIFDLLCEYGYLARFSVDIEGQGGDHDADLLPRVYFTGRNPTLLNGRRRNNFSWALSFVGDED